MQQIKNIIFDLGGIFININYKKTEDAFIAAGITNFNNLYNQHHATTLFEELETGKITPSNFYHQFRQISNSQISDTTIQTCWNAMLGDFLMKEIQWLQSIQHKYQMYLFSNTNQIHYNAFTYLFKQQTKQLSIDQYFKKAYYSHTFGYRKPYAQSYQKILNEQQLVASETLFIDDTLQNIEGAKLAGLQTIHLIAPKCVSELML